MLILEVAHLCLKFHIDSLSFERWFCTVWNGGFHRNFIGIGFLHFADVIERLEQRNAWETFQRNGEQNCTFGGMKKWALSSWISFLRRSRPLSLTNPSCVLPRQGATVPRKNPNQDFFSCKKIHHAGTQRKKDYNWNMIPFHSPNNKRKQRPRIAQIYETIPPQLKGK